MEHLAVPLKPMCSKARATKVASTLPGSISAVTAAKAYQLLQAILFTLVLNKDWWPPKGPTNQLNFWAKDLLKSLLAEAFSIR